MLTRTYNHNYLLLLGNLTITDRSFNPLGCNIATVCPVHRCNNATACINNRMQVTVRAGCRRKKSLSHRRELTAIYLAFAAASDGLPGRRRKTGEQRVSTSMLSVFLLDNRVAHNILCICAIRVTVHENLLSLGMPEQQGFRSFRLSPRFCRQQRNLCHFELRSTPLQCHPQPSTSNSREPCGRHCGPEHRGRSSSPSEPVASARLQAARHRFHFIVIQPCSFQAVQRNFRRFENHVGISPEGTHRQGWVAQIGASKED